MGKVWEKRMKGIRKLMCCLLAAVLLISASGCGVQGGQAREGDAAEPGTRMPADTADRDIGSDSAGDGGYGDTPSREGGSSGEGPLEESDSGPLEEMTGEEGAVEARSSNPSGEDAWETGAAAVADFGLRLLRGCMTEGGFPQSASMPQDVYESLREGKNACVSPLSVISALAMTGNGAEGETLAQMEETFGISVPELSAYLSACLDRYGDGEAAADGPCRMNMANGIWLTEDESFTVERDFLDTCADLFQAEARRAPFDDSTRKEINAWVKRGTEGMIEEILDEIPEGAVMYLVNALAFEAEWEEIYRDDQVWESEFTKEDGTVQTVEMMLSEETQYLEDEHATGFLKYYAGRRYAYAALLPEEGMTVQEYAALLDGAKLCRLLDNPAQTQVNAWIPRYETEYGAELAHVLQEMGMGDAFDPSRADFSGIGRSTDGNISISRVLHRTYIAVDERGTKAGAATAVEVRAMGAMRDVQEVRLNRPFLYMIIDCQENLPVFLGVVAEVESPGR